MSLYLNMANAPVKIWGKYSQYALILLSICPMHFEVEWHPTPYWITNTPRGLATTYDPPVMTYDHHLIPGGGGGTHLYVQYMYVPG